MPGANIHFQRIFRSLVSAAVVLLMMAFPGGHPVFASCAPAATNSDDVINCTNANDTIDALDGDDQVNGGGGNDTITGGAGDDSLTGGNGNDNFVFDTDNPLGRDVVNGGSGTDTLDFSGSTSAVTVNLGTTTTDQTVNGNLILRLSANLENITGGSGDDVLTGRAGNNILNGGAGNDRVVQTANANQTLTNTSLTGSGNDTLISIEAATLTGGAGNNTFTVSRCTGWRGGYGYSSELFCK